MNKSSIAPTKGLQKVTKIYRIGREKPNPYQIEPFKQNLNILLKHDRISQEDTTIAHIEVNNGLTKFRYKIKELDFSEENQGVINFLNNSFDHHFTKDFFSWKHLNNPFGKSYGLVAINEEEVVIGLRMFMFWKFSTRGEVKVAARPVDSATHPRYQGNGIFKALTIKGLSRLAGQYDFIFNTPNSNSLPLDLKMGWKILEGDFYYYINVVSFFKKKLKYKSINVSGINLENMRLASNETQKSIEYLKWRYQSRDYQIAEFKENELKQFLIFKIVKKKVLRKNLRMAVILDAAGEGNDLLKMVLSVCRQEGVFIYSYAGFGKTKGLKNFTSVRRGNYVIVSRNDEANNLGSLNFSSGDLEGIL